MMVAIDKEFVGSGKSCEHAFSEQFHTVRRSIAGSTLFVLDRARPLCRNILDERAASINIQHLHAETDRENRNSLLLGGCEDQEIGFVLDYLHRPQRLMGLLTIPQWIHVRI